MPLSTNAEYTNCFFAEKYDSPKVCPEYGTKYSDGEAPVMLDIWEIHLLP